MGSIRAMLLGSVLAAVAFVDIAIAHEHFWQPVVSSTVLGAGIGLTFSAMPNVIVEAVPPEQTGVATGMNANLRTIGGAIGGQVTASVLAASTVAGAYPANAGFTTSFSMLAVLALVSAVVAALIPRRLAFGPEDTKS
jgi:MFS family permease